MTFKLNGNELVGQPDMSNPEMWKAMVNGKDDMPKYIVLPEDIAYFITLKEGK